MKPLICPQCGGSSFTISGGYRVCDYCRTRFPAGEDAAGEGISLEADIERLLEKCRTNPKQARRYANLILDMDPDNEEARSYVRGERTR